MSYRFDDRAAGFSLVSAVAESTTLGYCLNIRECLAKALIQQSDSQFPHTRRIQEERPTWNPEELSSDRRVASLPVARTHFTGHSDGVAGEEIDQCRLADPGRPEEGNRAAGSKRVSKILYAPGVH